MSKQFKKFLLFMTVLGLSILISYSLNNTSFGVRTVEHVESCENDQEFIDCGFGPDDYGYTKRAIGLPFVHTTTKNSDFSTSDNTNYGRMALNYGLIILSLEVPVTLALIVKRKQ